mmetsp:Transcript_11773/g.23424  ORF Transcript_11773/g.23424 Transcript_11773/m.23424 type:complete len:259 (-) Transcript_11773:76-852(-)
MGAGVSALDDDSKANLAADIKTTLESKNDLDDKAMFNEISALLHRAEAKGEAKVEETPESEEGDVPTSMIIRPPVVESGIKTRRLSQQLQVHLIESDNEMNFKIGDVVKACPDPSMPGLKFEGLAVAVNNDTIVVDFGDGEEPTVCPKIDVQRVQNGSVLEVDDVVQCKPPGTPLYCEGKVIRVHEDGTYDIAYEGTDEIDENVELKYIRKVGSGRSSAHKKIKKAVSAITAARAFGAGFGSFGITPPKAEAKEDAKV